MTMIMNENQSSSLQDSKCSGKGDESLDFGSKEIYELNESSRDISEVKGRDEFKNDELPLMNSPRKQDQNGLSLRSTDQGKAADSFETCSHDEQQRSQEHEQSVSVGEDSRCNDSSSLSNSSSDLFQIETNSIADKNVPDRDAPEFEVCYKEIDQHVVKDICIDEGRPEMPHSDENDDSQANFTAADSSEKENSVVDSKRTVEEFTTQDGEENVKQQPDQIARLTQNPDVKLADAGAPGEVAQQNVAASNNDDEERIADTLSNSSPELDDSKLDNQPAADDDQVELPGNTSRSSTEDAETVEPRHVSTMARLLHDEGETSFSAASLINYSEPVPFSGSLSHRSDASTTSARSFAFPVLQNEWNSSPVRMAKADRRHLRKHKFWRSGLFCCKF